jgi:hypothetical protein
MSNIKYFVTTDLYWQTLGQYAGHPLFHVMRRKISECVIRKSQNATFRNNRDKPFDADPKLSGIWHCKLSDELDAILFYRIEGDTLYLNMVGTHHDYPADGKNSLKAGPLADKNRNAMKAGHVDYPARRLLKWSRPLDLVGNPMLEEIDRDELRAISDLLLAENDDPAIYRRLFARDLLDASEDELDAWLREINVAHVEIERAFRRIDMARLTRRDRRAIESLERELAIDRDEILSRDGSGFTVACFVEAVRTAAGVQSELSCSSSGARNLRQILADFEEEPAENAQRLLVAARRLAVDLARKSEAADSAAFEIERLLAAAEGALGDPDSEAMEAYAASGPAKGR